VVVLVPPEPPPLVDVVVLVLLVLVVLLSLVALLTLLVLVVPLPPEPPLLVVVPLDDVPFFSSSPQPTAMAPMPKNTIQFQLLMLVVPFVVSPKLTPRAC